MLSPHFRATPDWTQGFDRAWPQNLYLAPSSPLLPHLRLPPGFDVARTPLVTFRRIDTLLEPTALDALYGHYRQTFELWQKAGIGVPPCFIIVCNNTAASKLVYDYVSGFDRASSLSPSARPMLVVVFPSPAGVGLMAVTRMSLPSVAVWDA